MVLGASEIALGRFGYMSEGLYSGGDTPIHLWLTLSWPETLLQHPYDTLPT